MKNLFLVVIFLFSCGEETEKCVIQEDYLEDGFILEQCRCRYRSSPEKDTIPWSKCKSKFKTIYFCVEELLWCPYDRWGWQCSDSLEENINEKCGTL